MNFPLSAGPGNPHEAKKNLRPRRKYTKDCKSRYDAGITGGS